MMMMVRANFQTRQLSSPCEDEGSSAWISRPCHAGRQRRRHHDPRGERERLFGSREREGKLKITFPFYGKGTGIRKLLREGKGREI